MRTDGLGTLMEIGVSGHCLGRIVGIDACDQPLVDFPGNDMGPVAALATITIPREMIDGDREVLLVFIDGDRTRPVVVGLIQDQPFAPLHKIGRLQPRTPIEVSSDGERLSLVAHTELHLVCGESSITLRKDGKVVINGRHLLSRAKVVNRIKGGSVQIN